VAGAQLSGWLREELGKTAGDHSPLQHGHVCISLFFQMHVGNSLETVLVAKFTDLYPKAKSKRIGKKEGQELHYFWTFCIIHVTIINRGAWCRVLNAYRMSREILLVSGEACMDVTCAVTMHASSLLDQRTSASTFH
jgi:hypothetical protein